MQELGALYNNDSTVRELCDTAKQIEGMTRHASRHACGVVIGREALDELVPLEEKDGDIITQYHAKAIEKVGLVKLDFLGLQNNTVINDTLELIEQRHGTKIDLENIDLTDKKVYDMLGRGDGIAVFQMEGVGMRSLLREMKPENLEHIIAQISLYRPGPMDEIPKYIDGRHGGKVTYPHPKLEGVLKDTYGMLLYQEQVMQASQVLAGFTGGQSESLMKAMSKKKADEMAAMKPLFLDGCKTNGISAQDATDIFDRMEAFAKYAFNKCISGADTRIILPDGTRMRVTEAFKNPPREIMAMWPDGEIRPHRVQKIVQTGRKSLLKIMTQDKRVLKATPEHRLLTTKGYLPVSEMKVGDELMSLPRVSEKQPAARSENMRAVNAHPKRSEWAQQTSARMTAYQAARPMEDKVAHMKKMHQLHPDLTRAGVAAMHERVRYLMHNDADWRDRHRAASLLSVRDCYDSGPGYGRCSIASNGMWCASTPEREMCEWLLAQNIEFEMHKLLPNGRICDFYFGGVYWEMDGMDRVAEYFEAKYDALPFVVVTPEDFKFRVEHHLQLAHAENGDAIVSIEPCGKGMTYDIEMAPDGPLNFIANGLVSHNSHAAYYALVSYWTAFLKVNYPSEFMACKMTSLLEKKDKLLVVIDDCRKHGIEVLPPDVNESNHEFTVVPGGIRFGLQAIKGIGEAPVNAICAARKEGGKFVSLFDFCERVLARACGKAALETLVKCGAFDSIHPNRKAMLDAVEGAIESGQKAQADALSGQINMFGESNEMGRPKSLGHLGNTEDAPRNERLAWEKEYLGLYVSDHPLGEMREYLEANATPLERLGTDPQYRDGNRVTIGGLVTTVKKMVDKNGRTWAAFTLEDLTGSLEVLAFAKTFDKCSAIVVEDAKLMVRGRLAADNRRGGRQQNNDDEGEGEATVFKIMADEIEEIPADAADADAAPVASTRNAGNGAAENASAAPPLEDAASALNRAHVEDRVAASVESAAQNGAVNGSFNGAPSGNGSFGGAQNGGGSYSNGGGNGSQNGGGNYANGAANGNGANGNGSQNGGGNGNGAAPNDGMTMHRTPALAAPLSSAPPMAASTREYSQSGATPSIARAFAPPPETASCVHLHIAESRATHEVLGQLWNICRQHPGETEVWLHIDNGVEMLQMRVSDSFWVTPTAEFCNAASRVIGEQAVLMPC